MNKKILTLTGIFLILCMSFIGCTNTAVKSNLWSDATYTEDTELGKGNKTVLVSVVTEEKTIVFTIHSDKQSLGEALLEHDLVEGEKGAYGLYVKKVNGILADYDIDQSYWGINKKGERLMTGVDDIIFKDGEEYELVYTR